jgi:hypothetical protein
LGRLHCLDVESAERLARTTARQPLTKGTGTRIQDSRFE